MHCDLRCTGGAVVIAADGLAKRKAEPHGWTTPFPYARAWSDGLHGNTDRRPCRFKLPPIPAVPDTKAMTTRNRFQHKSKVNGFTENKGEVKSLQSPQQFERVPRAVPDGENLHLPMLLVDGEIDRVRPRSWQLGLVHQTSDSQEAFGVMRQSSQEGLEIVVEAPPDAGLLTLIPVNGLVSLPLGVGLSDDPECHLRARRRCLMAAETSSMGVPRPGCLSASSARRSSSTACSGVNSSAPSPNSCRTCSTTSYCSPGGRRRICSMISDALMRGNYSRRADRQGGFPRPHSALRVPHSAFP